MSAWLERLELLTAEQPPDRDRGAIELEVAGISAVLANHLAYEERVLVSVLDRLEVDDDSREAQALRAPLDGIFEPREPSDSRDSPCDTRSHIASESHSLEVDVMSGV